MPTVGQRVFFCLMASPEPTSSFSLRSPGRKTWHFAQTELGWSQSHVALMMCLRHKASRSSSGGQFDILLPGKVQVRKSRSVSNTNNPGEIHYKWPAQKKRLLLLAMGVEESVYESINLCGWERTAESSQVLPLLKQLLGCVPGISLPEDVDADHVDCLLPLD